MTKWKIYNQDVIEWAEQYEKGKFHALFTDAPYHLTSIVKRFGKNGSAPAKFGTDGVFSRTSKGRILVPFSGSGSEMIGAGLAGWEHVVGVEFDTENGYVDIANKRLEHWLNENK